MVGGVCGVRDDIIPFGLVNGQYAVLEGLNIIGMKRRKFTKQRLATVRAFYQKLFHGPGMFAERLGAVQALASEDLAIAEILDFIGKGKHRPLCLPAIEK
jgi:UDP-N-acetylglucosamine acyltransferase